MTATTRRGCGTRCPRSTGRWTAIDDDAAGPLRELLNRIGVQVAVVRRSIDGLWADQFIETCADWVIPYLGTLVATGQVTGLDPRGQRLDVANTIDWRRRKGTLPTAEAVARDITGWDAHVVEGFRRLARTWHDLDPPPAGDPGHAPQGHRAHHQNTRRAGSPTCAPRPGHCSPAARSTRHSTMPTCAGAAGPSAGSARRSSSSTAGGC